MKQMRVTISVLLCLAIALSVFGCDSSSSKKKSKKSKKKSSKVEIELEEEEDEDEDEDEDETEASDDDDQAINTGIPAAELVGKEEEFVQVSGVLLNISSKDFSSSDYGDYKTSAYHDPEIDLEYYEYDDEDSAKAKFEEYTTIASNTIDSIGKDARIQIDDDQVVFDEDLIMPDGSSKYCYGIAAISENSIYYMAYYGHDVDTMWNMTNTIGMFGFEHPYYVLGADPDMERLTASGLDMEGLIKTADKVLDVDGYYIEEEYLYQDCLQAYSYFNENYCVMFEMFDLPYTTQIYLNSYYGDVTAQYPDAFTYGNEGYFFGEVEDSGLYIYGGMFKSDYYLITIEIYDEEYNYLAKDLIDELGLPTPDGI